MISIVENSLGRLWIEGHPNDDLKANWKYYLGEAKQEPKVQKQLDEIHREYSALMPEDILCVDPCMGSGHIICYLFDVLMQIYEAYGYTTRDAVSSIVRNNLYGLDIDGRASQLAYFSVMMKACQYDHRFLSRGIQPHVYAIMESNGFDTNMIDTFTGGRKELKTAISSLVSDLHDAKEYGSILDVKPVDFTALYARFDEIRNENLNMFTYQILDELLPFVQVAEVMSQKYHVVVTNPPYMGSSGMSGKLSEFVKRNYPDSKSDLFAVFIERCGQMTLKNCFQAMITQHAWMFLSSFEKLRKKLLQKTMVNMAHLGARAFEEIGGEVVQTTSFVLLNDSVEDYKGVYCRLIEPTTQQSKEETFLNGDSRFVTSQSNFAKIPGSPVAYWVSDQLVQDFIDGKPFAEVGFPKVGMQTSNNDKYLRLWHEVKANEFFSNSKKWIKYVKGGQFRRWYGNLEYVVWYNGTPDFILQQKNARVLSESELTVPKCTWTDLATTRYSSRIAPLDSFHDISGHCFYPSKAMQMYLLGYTNSKVFQTIIDLLNSSLHYQVGDVARVPVLIDNVEALSGLVQDNVNLSKTDWDSFETSWDFQRHPLIRNTRTLREAFTLWQSECDDRFNQLKANEEELNRIFIDIYGLQDELTPEEEDKDVTVRKADLGRDIRSFVSYAVGCMMGRYSLDVDGLAYAGGDWDSSKYKTFIPDKDAIIPITDDEYFKDDIVGRFVDFVRTVYGTDTLEENLKFIADALGEKGSTSREVIRNYFLNDFYKDHCKIYQKRPIYWLFDSGKKNGFKCLAYMHCYQPDTIARIRTDYVHEQQARYRTAISGLERQISGASTSDRVRLNKQLEKLKDQAEETRLYEEKIHHLADQMISIDLDDGVKHNYAIFQDVLAKIK